MEAILAKFVVPVFLGVLSWVGNSIRKKMAEKMNRNKAYDALETAVSELYHEKVKDLKAKAADGKLTKADINSLKKSAIDKAKTIAEEKGVDFIQDIGERVASGLIDKIVAFRKRRR